MAPTVYYGDFVHSISLTELEYLHHGLLCVSEHGIIEWVLRDVEGSLVQQRLADMGLTVEDVEMVELAEGEFICPGLVDTHTHAPQYPNMGTGQGYQLLEWLEKLTFPRESRFENVAYAKQVYEKVVRRNLDAGTTTCCYYATLHEGASKVLADVVHGKGQRAFVGKCNMDRECPDYYIETTSSSLASTKSFLEHFASYPPTSLVQPILTPRFAICCTPDLLASLSELSRSKTPSIAIQTHLSENPSEVELTKSLFPDCETYAGVYDKFGLLGEGTILAHCVHLTEEEQSIIKRTNAGISHCPSSNLNLNSGSAKVTDMLDKGIKVGLGTDCSGGYSLGILSAVRQASNVSKTLAFTPPLDDKKPLSIPTLFHMATLGGASLCRLQDRIGNFTPGKEFDALRILPKSPGMWVEEGERLESVFEKWLFTGDDRDLKSVWVRGTQVGGWSL